jgi:predicted  nucleic acid-binding Zn-ribbon protein
LKVTSHQPLLKTAEQTVDQLARLRKSRNRWKDKAVSRASQIRDLRKEINRIEAEIEAEIAAGRLTAKLIEEEVDNGD